MRCNTLRWCTCAIQVLNRRSMCVVLGSLQSVIGNSLKRCVSTYWFFWVRVCFACPAVLNVCLTGFRCTFQYLTALLFGYCLMGQKPSTGAFGA